MLILFVLLLVTYATAQNIEKLETTGLSLCNQGLFKDPTAQVTIPTNAVSMDNTSVQLYGPNSNVKIERDASVTLKIQSGLRILKKAQLHIHPQASLYASESSHQTVGGKLTIGERTKLSFEASRSLAMGIFHMARDVNIFLSDNSLLRVYEGGYASLGAISKVEIFRGAAVEVSDWWQHSGLDDIQARLEMGEKSVITLQDRASLHVARGSLNGNTGANLNLRQQSKLLVKGQLNITADGKITVNSQATFHIGYDREETRYNPQTAPTFVFVTNNQTLTIGDRKSLRVALNTHCMLTQSMVVNEDVTLTHTTTDKPYVRCFARLEDLKSAVSAAQ